MPKGTKCDSCMHWWDCDEAGTGFCDDVFVYERHPAITKEEAIEMLN